jgi:1-deoxy-D-xylulose-5-phosphate reductoisomerase
LNAANEVAVQGFLDGRIGFLDIEAVVEGTLAKLPYSRLDNLDTVRHIDAEARREAAMIVALRNDET